MIFSARGVTPSLPAGCSQPVVPFTTISTVPPAAVPWKYGIRVTCSVNGAYVINENWNWNRNWISSNKPNDKEGTFNNQLISFYITGTQIVKNNQNVDGKFHASCNTKTVPKFLYWKPNVCSAFKTNKRKTNLTNTGSWKAIASMVILPKHSPRAYI